MLRNDCIDGIIFLYLHACQLRVLFKYKIFDGNVYRNQDNAYFIPFIWLFLILLTTEAKERYHALLQIYVTGFAKRGLPHTSNYQL